MIVTVATIATEKVERSDNQVPFNRHTLLDNENARDDLDHCNDALHCATFFIPKTRHNLQIFATIATIVEIKLRSISSIIAATIATIAEKFR